MLPPEIAEREVMKRVRENGGFTVFWVTETQSIAEAATRLIDQGKIVRKTGEGFGRFPWCGYDITPEPTAPMKDRPLLRFHAFSDDRVYRYTLWRDWSDDSLELEEREGNHSHQFVQFIGLNPSTADETRDDNTLRKCIGFAKRWGYGALCMTNLFAFRATNPKDMLKAADPIGTGNTGHILRCAREAGIVIAAWGVKGEYKAQDLAILVALRDIGVTLKCLRMNDDGTPEHPLYVPYNVKPVDWTP